MIESRGDFVGARRRFLKTVATGAAGLTLGRASGSPAAGPASGPVRPQTVRDKLWIFACPAGTDNTKDNHWGLPKVSRMTPAEGAFYLGVPNLMLIRADGKPPIPSDQYAIPFRPLKRVLWSLTGSGGRTSEEVREDAFRLARRFPNIVGFIMDDFFHKDGSGNLSVEQLRDLRKRFFVDGRKLDLYVVVYTHMMHLPIREHLKYCDKITLWTWNSRDLRNLEENFQRLEKMAPNHGKLLGCYTWDYPNKQAVRMDLMKKQCRLGLSWLKEGRLEGMIFLANTTGDLELETWEYARKWIAENGDKPL